MAFNMPAITCSAELAVDMSKSEQVKKNGALNWNFTAIST